MPPTMSLMPDPKLDTLREHPRQPTADKAVHPALKGSLTPPVHCPSSKILNFSPGPTSLPPEVEAEIKIRCFPQSASDKRLSTMALSHRSPEFGLILKRAVSLTRKVMSIPPEYEILFMQGGGNGQFAAVPMNLCPTGKEKATYVVNGTWSRRAVDEATKYCEPSVVSSANEDGTYTSYPSFEEISSKIEPDTKFVYLCSNETVNGLELHRLPRFSAPLVVDASSDFTSKPITWRESNVGVLFACASKNIGHPGVTMVVVRNDLLDQSNPFCPGVFNYNANILAGNVWNTTPTFNVDVVGIMMEWLLSEGGMEATEEKCIAKSSLLYRIIDQSNGFYSTPVASDSGVRSRMNVPFSVGYGDESLTDLFLIECWNRGIVGLRTVTPFSHSGFLRASLYHGVSMEEVRELGKFMVEFARKHCKISTDLHA